MPDDHYQSEKLLFKIMESHKNLIPSVNFDEYGYSLYLQYASAGELENDIVSEKTYLKMIYDGNWDDQPTNSSQSRMRYL